MSQQCNSFSCCWKLEAGGKKTQLPLTVTQRQWVAAMTFKAVAVLQNVLVWKGKTKICWTILGTKFKAQHCKESLCS